MTNLLRSSNQSGIIILGEIRLNQNLLMRIDVDINFRVQREKALQKEKIRLINLSLFHWFTFEKVDRFFGIRRYDGSTHRENREI